MACLAESVGFYGHFLLLLFVMGYQYENAKVPLLFTWDFLDFFF